MKQLTVFIILLLQKLNGKIYLLGVSMVLKGNRSITNFLDG